MIFGQRSIAGVGVGFGVTGTVLVGCCVGSVTSGVGSFFGQPPVGAGIRSPLCARCPSNSVLFTLTLIV